MTFDEINASSKYSPLVQQKTANQDIRTSKDETFASTLDSFITDVDSLQKDSAEMNEKLIKGDPVDLHDVMISAEKAKTGFTLMMELRNKFLDLYKEVLRMQV